MHSSKDTMIWMLSTSGDFYIKSVYDEIRESHPISLVNSSIWQTLLPIKISFFMSNMMLNKIPLDLNLHRFGIHGPSTCFCCSNKSEESRDHLFSFGDKANLIWQYFENPLGIRGSDHHLRKRCLNFWLYKPMGEIFDRCINILPSLICWYIWKWRNN